MKLHDFIAKQETQKAERLHSLGKAISQYEIAPVEEAKAPTAPSEDLNGDGHIDGMDAAIMILTQGNKAAHKKIRHHD